MHNTQYRLHEWASHTAAQKSHDHYIYGLYETIKLSRDFPRPSSQISSGISGNLRQGQIVPTPKYSAVLIVKYVSNCMYEPVSSTAVWLRLDMNLEWATHSWDAFTEHQTSKLREIANAI